MRTVLLLVGVLVVTVAAAQDPSCDFPDVPGAPQIIGACCLPSGACGIADKSVCEGLGGYWWGPDFPTCESIPGGGEPVCAAPGSCCLSNGACEILPEWQCCQTDSNAVWVAQGTCATCQTFVFGACCLPTGVCEVRTEDNCDSGGGIWRGSGTTCGDFNGNGIADRCETISVCEWDLNGDGSVNVPDLLELLANWGPCH